MQFIDIHDLIFINMYSFLVLFLFLSNLKMIVRLASLTVIVICIKLTVCSQNLVFEENQTAVLSCSVNVQGLINGYIFWYSPTIQIAACTCGSVDNSVYCQCDYSKLQANYTNIQPTKSLLTIQNVSIQDSGKWRCVLLADNLNGTDKGTYDLLVIARPQEIKCDTYFTDNNSQLQILCKTIRVYPGAVCEFLKTNSQLNNSLVVYNHTEDANRYFVSTCYVKVPLLQLTPGLLNVSIKIYPNGSNSSYGLNSETNIELDYPDPVLTDCPSPKENVNQNYIKYGSNTTCTCSTNRPGNPPATTIWINSSTDSVLRINTTGTGDVYNCSVVNAFGQTVAAKSLSYKPNIAYGPFNVALLFKSPVYKETLNICNKQPLNISVSCMSTEANPPDISFTITVNGSSETAVTSLKEFSKNISVALPGPLDISCTATNRIFESLYSTSRTSVSVQKPPELAPVILINQIPTRSSEINVHEDEDVIVSCEITGGVPNIANITIRCGLNSTRTIGNNAFLALGKISKERIGQKCECMAEHVTGCYMNNSTSILLNLIHKAKITKFSVFTGGTNANEVTNGSLVTFKCEADGNPRPVITIANKRKQYQADSDGTVSIVMTCVDGGVYFCKATNVISSDNMDNSSLTINIFCPMQFTDSWEINNKYFITESKSFSHQINIFGYPAPTYLYIQKLNLTSKTYDKINFNQINTYVAYNAEQKISLMYFYDDPPFGVIIISIQNIDLADFSQYILYITNNVTSNHLSYTFTLKDNPSSSSNDVLVAAIVGTLSGVVVTAFLSILFIKRGDITRLIRKHESKGNNYPDTSTTSTGSQGYEMSSHDIVPRNVGYDQSDVARTYDSLDHIQSEGNFSNSNPSVNNYTNN